MNHSQAIELLKTLISTPSVSREESGVADIVEQLSELKDLGFENKVLKIYTSFDGVSATAGHNGENKQKLKEKYGFKKIKVFGENGLQRRKVRIEVEG